MYIRYFATNRNRENLGQDIERDQRIRLQRGGYHWIDTTQYMSYYLATTDTQKMPSSAIIKNSDQEIFAEFLNLPSINNIIICIHGFNNDLNEALTSFSVLTDTLNETPALQGKILVDPNKQKTLLENGDNLTAVIGFSWPSNGESGPLAYRSDQGDATHSATALANLISNLRNNNSNAKIHIIAHSMGCFMTCSMLGMLVNQEIFTIVQGDNRQGKEDIEKRLKRRQNGEKIDFFVDCLFLLAPDVERRHVTQCNKPDTDEKNPESLYSGPFYAGLYHLVRRNYLFYSRYDKVLQLSRTEKEALREAPDRLLRTVTFQAPNPDNLWENSLGLNPAPELAPSNLYSYNASFLSNRNIDHGDYFDTPDIVNKIAELIANY